MWSQSGRTARPTMRRDSTTDGPLRQHRRRMLGARVERVERRSLVISKALLRTAQEHVDRLMETCPNVPPLQSIRRQLSYLVDYTEGLNAGERLNDVEPGIQAAPFQEPATELFMRETAGMTRLAAPSCHLTRSVIWTRPIFTHSPEAIR